MKKQVFCPKCGNLKNGKFARENQICKSCSNKKRKGMKMKGGWHHSKETKKRISNAHKKLGWKPSKEQIEKIKEANTGRKLSNDAKLKLSWIQFNRQGGEFKKKTKAGYISIFSPEHPNKNSGSRVFEHRLVMEKKIGRYLEKCEMVHHLNSVKDDNREENLYLVKSHKEHSEKEVKGLTCPHCNIIINNLKI